MREINSLLRSGKPVYAVLGHRNARVVRVQTQFGDCAIIAEDINGTKHRVSSKDFIDGNGNEVCASRARS